MSIIRKLVSPSSRVTSDYLSTTERARVISIRAQQINDTGKHFLSDDEKIGLNTAEDIARKEVELRKSPLKIIRPIGEPIDGVQYIEEWKLSELKNKIYII